MLPSFSLSNSENFQKILRYILPSIAFSNFKNFQEYLENSCKFLMLSFLRAVGIRGAIEHNALPVSFLRAIQILANPPQDTFEQLVAAPFQFLSVNLWSQWMDAPPIFNNIPSPRVTKISHGPSFENCTRNLKNSQIIAPILASKFKGLWQHPQHHSQRLTLISFSKIL